MSFHWRDGITFLRKEDGLVEMFIPTEPHASTGTVEHIPAAEWASIIAAVSAEGETGSQYQNALVFHDHDSSLALMFHLVPRNP